MPLTNLSQDEINMLKHYDSFNSIIYNFNKDKINRLLILKEYIYDSSNINDPNSNELKYVKELIYKLLNILDVPKYSDEYFVNYNFYKNMVMLIQMIK